ncbi:MAG: hypothetical protein J1G30_05255 [Spirochaetales bacterium]|nr:hypothetical protein [Spirochaetales bacterium]
MKKHTASLIFFISALFAATAQSADIPNELSSVLFKIDKISRHQTAFANTKSNVFNAAYSSALPAGCIYKIKTQQNNREVIVQIEYHPKNLQNNTVYLSDDVYNFLTLEDSSFESDMNVQLSFVGWCNEKAQSDFLNIQSLVVEPKDSRREIIQNGLDKYYIQLGAFQFYQNSFGLITSLLPYLQVRPNFYITKTSAQTSCEDVFKVLAGPYSHDDAVRISGFINSFSKDSVMLKSSTDAIKGDKKK